MTGILNWMVCVFNAFDAGPQFKFTEAISMFVSCETQDEIDHFWENFTADGGQESMCGWLKDKFEYPGKSFRRYWVNCLAIKTGQRQGERWRP